MSSQSSSPEVHRSRTLTFLVIAGLVILAIGIHRGRISGRGIWWFAALVPSVILHEVAHGAVAAWFGDDTARRAGRLTLNPVSHIDVFGTLILPATLALFGTAPFGYAKPVPVDPRRLRSPRNQMLAVSLSGPAVNMAIALLSAAALHLNVWPLFFQKRLLDLGLVNVVLATFNLIPIPPLDGSVVIERFLPPSLRPIYYRFRPYAIFVLMALVFFSKDFLGQVFDPSIRLWFRLLP